MSEDKTYTVDEAHRKFAIKTNGRIWELLEKGDRNQSEDDELLYAAFASCYHWSKVGTGVHQQRAEYLVAKAYISLGIPEQALRHATRCIQLTDQYQGEMKDFDIAYAHECLSRAYAMNGKPTEAKQHYTKAKAEGEQIRGSEDRKIFDADMTNGPWFGLV